MKGPAFLGRRQIIRDSGIPPTAFPIREIRGQLDGKAPLACVLLLNPSTMPGVIGKRMGFEPAALPGIGAVSLLVEDQCDDRSFFVVPLAGQNPAVFLDARGHDGGWSYRLMSRRSSARRSRAEHEGRQHKVPLRVVHTPFHITGV